jgi:hydrogenase/urease accessory protein HupE
MRIAALAASLACAATPASAHPLDVYVQAAEIDVARTGVVLQLRLTPGVYVARRILAGIDTNNDGVISDAEQAAYADRVRRDVSFTVDGRAESLRLVSSSCAPVALMTRGLGDIVLVFQGDGPRGDGAHTITFQNHHEPAVAAYLVNVLAPQDAGVRVVSQSRNYDQSWYRLDVTLGAPADLARANPSGLRGGLASPDAPAVLATFFWHGVRHILTGYDHLLFLGALVLAAVTFWDLFKVVTAFTVAHSITLTLSALRLVHLSDRVVEPTIAASIVFVALQNVFWLGKARGWTRLVVAFVFGLFHGLGFAGGLLDVMHQMPTAAVLLAILGFSLGVEAGNQIVLIPLFGSMRLARRMRPDAEPRFAMAFQRTGSAVILVAGVYYLGVALSALI